jgi:hypothetical protein
MAAHPPLQAQALLMQVAVAVAHTTALLHWVALAAVALVAKLRQALTALTD